DSLIDSDPLVDCRFFNGGYVLVPYKPGLYSDQFTIEAWVKIDALALDFDHTLFDAGGVYAFPAGSGAGPRGFRLFADRNRSWQVRMGPGLNDLLAQPPLVPLGARTHVALTVANDGPAGGGKKVTLYVDGKVAGTATVTSYAPPDGAPLYIGVENTANAPTANANLRNPVLCRIQEVVLHREALPKELIENHVDINR
ncbi:MAG: LamG domain-containing protein, partial [Candidatus Rokuibacteriota bacterium]